MSNQLISSLKMQIKIHDAKEPMQKDYLTVYGYENAYKVWAKASRKLFTEILELESE